MSPVPELIQKHVPAWKKLGLKLKFAKEEPEDPQPRDNGNGSSKKRKIPLEDEGAIVEKAPAESSVKKVKKSKLRAEDSGEVPNGNSVSNKHQDEAKSRNKIKKSKPTIEESVGALNGDPNHSSEPTNEEGPSKKTKKPKVKSTTSINGRLDDTHEQQSSSAPQLKTTPASKGKSVSFTPDTKTKDGDSVKSLYKTWIAKQIATDPSFDPSTISPALKSIVPSVVAPPESPSPITSASTSNSKPKPTKKPKTRLPKISSGHGPSRFDPVLTYLTTHHTSPKTWKFSKSHQNQILKHLFSLNHIPPSYNAALLSYLRGLDSASARSRVRKEALTIREDDEKWLTSEPSEAEKMNNETTAQCNARRQHDYEAAVARFKQSLKDKEHEREEREAELLGENEEWEERFRKRKRAEIVLWSVGAEEEVAAPSHTSSSSRQDTSKDTPIPNMQSGLAQLAQAARDAPVPAPRVGKGVGMGMGGVEVIDAGGIAKASRGKKVVFGQDDGAAAAPGDVNGSGSANGVRGVNGVKRKRKTKKRIDMPDDDDSSDSSSSSSSDDEEGKKQPQRKKVVINGKGAESPSSSSSGGDSGSE